MLVLKQNKPKHTNENTKERKPKLQNIPQKLHHEHNLGWGAFCQAPSVGSGILVREFFANATVVDGPTSYVQGKTIDYRPTAINQFFGIPTPELDPLKQFIKQAQFDHVVASICYSPTDSFIQNNGEWNISGKRLNRTAKICFKFMVHRLTPTSHHNNLNKERACILFSIEKGWKINVGRIFSSNIFHAFNNIQVRLPYASLLTALFESAGISLPSEDLISPI